MVADQPNWAYDHMARFVIKELQSKYDFYIDYCSYHSLKKNHISQSLIRGRYSEQFRYLKFSFKRRVLPKTQAYDLVCFLGWYFPFAYDFQITGKRIIQGIFTDGFPPKGHGLKVDPGLSIEEFVRKYLGNSTTVICGSRLILDRYKSYVENVHYCTGAINTRRFKTPVRKHEGFIVGWTGDPHRSFKGFYDFVVPAVEKAASLRPGISLKTRFKGPYRTLHTFYQDVDVLLIASTGDAGPSSFLEAGACGVPSLSTRIGFPAETIRDGENGMFVDRSVEDMSRAIIFLHDNRENLKSMSSNIRADIEKSWTPAARSGLWDLMFQESLAGAKAS